MVSLIKGNGPQPAGRGLTAAAGRGIGRVGNRTAGGAPGRAGAALQCRRGGGAHPQGAGVPGGAARAPTGPGEAVSARIPHLLRAGRGRGAGGLDAGAGPHRDGADLPRAGRGVWRDLRGVCLFLDGGDPAPLLRRKPHCAVCTGGYAHPHPGRLLQQPQLALCPAGVPGLVYGVYAAAAAISGGGGAAGLALGRQGDRCSICSVHPEPVRVHRRARQAA